MKIPQVPAWALGILLVIAVAAGQANAAELKAPEEGTAAERTKKLWQASRPVIGADAKANYSDAEYMKRRGPVWQAWIGLQMSTAGENTAVSKLIPDVLSLINDVYGWTADSPARRQEIRERARKSIDHRVASLDKRVVALK